MIDLQLQHVLKLQVTELYIRGFFVSVFIRSHEAVSFPHLIATSTVLGQDICLAALVIIEMAIVATQASTLIISM